MEEPKVGDVIKILQPNRTLYGFRLSHTDKRSQFTPLYKGLTFDVYISPKYSIFNSGYLTYEYISCELTQILFGG